ncbi:MAG TPA: histidine phosphatase family protein [Pyrinomonadaceae bacterium]|nr:histidine phosphatase family protein [Pyrinomonadaceae bacterium]
MTKLFLIRHGQSNGNAEGRFGGHSDTPLSDLGIKQAKKTAIALAREGITAIYSSDLDRAVQTAQPLSQLTGLPIIKSAAFRERDVGILEGLTFDESKRKFPRDFFALVQRNYHHIITGGESYRHLVRRSTTELWQIIRQNQGGSIAIFSHTGAICFMTLHLIGAIRRDTKQTPWIVTSNCGINRFEIRSRRNIRILAINDTRHLSEPTGNDAFAATEI